MRGDDTRVIQILATPDGTPQLGAVQDAIRQLTTMVALLEGRQGPVNLRDSLIVRGDGRSPLSLFSNDFRDGSFHVFFGVITGEDTFIAKGATLSGAVDRAQWTATDTAATILKLVGKIGGFEIYVNTDLTVGQAFIPTLVMIFGAPSAKVTHSAVQSIPDTTSTALAFDTESWDFGGFHDNLVNNSRLTIPRAGIYDFGAFVRFAANSVGQREVEIRLNGSSALAEDRRNALATATVIGVTVSGSHQFVVGDYVEVFVTQTSGGALNVNRTVGFDPAFWISYRRS